MSESAWVEWCEPAVWVSGDEVAREEEYPVRCEDVAFRQVDASVREAAGDR